METIRLDDALPQMGTFDLLLCSGHGVFSDTIKLLSGSNISHLETVIGKDMVDYLPTIHPVHFPLSFTSAKDPIGINLLTGTYKSGVQAVELAPRIRGYDGDVYWRKWYGEITDTMLITASIFMLKFCNHGYEQSIVELLRSVRDVGPWNKNVENRDWLFCSETVFAMLGDCGVTVTDEPSNEKTPGDGAGEIKMMRGYFGDVLKIAI